MYSEYNKEEGRKGILGERNIYVSLWVESEN
jgi:hypothetical protein